MSKIIATFRNNKTGKIWVKAFNNKVSASRGISGIVNKTDNKRTGKTRLAKGYKYGKIVKRSNTTSRRNKRY